MGYRLRLHSEIRDWLTDLRGTQPELARRVGEAVVALLDTGERLGPPLVVPVESVFRPPVDPREALDYSYQRQLEGLQKIRRGVAGKDSHGQHQPAACTPSQSPWQAPSPRLALSAELKHIPGRQLPGSTRHGGLVHPTHGRELASKPEPWVLTAGPHVSHAPTVRPALKKAVRE